jgi:uridine kinase
MESENKLSRKKVIKQLADAISHLKRPYPVRVGIDGVDGAGKTRLADDLAIALSGTKRNVIRISIDFFHRPAAERYRQGRYSPQGYYEDNFNYQAVLSDVLEPLGPGGELQYRTASHNFQTDEAIDAPWKTAEKNSIILFDGVFLKRPELAKSWDYHIFVDCSFEEALKRVLKRDEALFGGKPEVRKLYQERFFPGQRLYLDAVKPKEIADAVAENDDPENPRLVVRTKPRERNPGKIPSESSKKA